MTDEKNLEIFLFVIPAFFYQESILADKNIFKISP